MTAILILHNFSPRELRRYQIDGPLIIERRVRPSAKAFSTHFLQIDLEKKMKKKKIILGNRRHLPVLFILFQDRAYTYLSFILCSTQGGPKILLK